MRNRETLFYFRWISLILISISIVAAMFELVRYSRTRSNYPPGMTIAGVPVNGLDPQSASQRLIQVYTQPIELVYGNAIIHVQPSTIGFEIDIESMLAAADLTRTGSSFWTGFWDFLWNRQPASADIPLRASFSEDRLQAFLLQEIAARYDKPPTSALPVPGNVNFAPGQPGQTLNINRAVVLIEDALRSPTNRSVALTFQRTASSRPSIQNLEILLKQIVDLAGFEGVVGLYLMDLQTNEELHFLYLQGQDLPTQPDLAFTASSTIKIPIMISYVKRSNGNIDQEKAALIMEMIFQSENPPADKLMDEIDPVRGPLFITEDLKALGFENSFLAGFFFPGAPLLQVIRTPANQRSDYNTNPDPYNQTTPSEMGLILEDLYICAETGGGALVAAFPNQITQASCREMVNFLAANKIGVLIEAGVPDGTRVAHKHGWVTDNSGVIQNISDAAIVYTPGGNYVLTIYTYHPVQAIWDKVSNLIATLSQAVYNYFNLQSQ